ncbi:glutathione S-transferase family protein [Nitratireductor sp. XY-223]|uniref:glutathione S-transferase family protein n=1 Tax=Nitratireductor sp. XY-223 TaxID=2561926 RepID=UPI0010AB49AF|nr:glutathione S-transferase family protein [Nitratireductor sp. XY-223]
MIRLYSIPPSLYSAKVRIVLRAKGLAFEDIQPPGGYGSDAYREIVPSGTLPAIEHDGFLLVESEAINEYLNELVPEPALLPRDMGQRAQARALSRFHDTRLEPAVRALFAHVDPDRRDTDFVAGQALVIADRLAQLERMANPSPLLTGETLSLADCGYPITLTFLEMLNRPMDLGVVLPDAVAAYFEALKREPSIAWELDSYRPALAAWVGSVTGTPA